MSDCLSRERIERVKSDVGKTMMLKLTIIVLSLLSGAAFGSQQPVYIGFDGGYGQKSDTSAQAIELGAQIAIDEINSRGGVLGGRPLSLVATDNQGLTMRGRDNYIALAKRKDLVAVLGGKHSPVIVESIPDTQLLKLPYISVWGSANQITDSVSVDSYMFRLSLKDEWGGVALLRQAAKISTNHKICVLAPNTAWGRSGERVLHDKAQGMRVNLASVNWYNWGDKEFGSQLDGCTESGATVIIMIANEPEGALIVNEIARKPVNLRLPIVAHWGITGGAFAALTGHALDQVDLRVIQTFSFVNNQRPRAQSLAKKVMAKQGVNAPDMIQSPVGVAQAYDMVYLLASAVNEARSTDGTRVRDALEHLPPYDGVIRRYAPAFTPSDHDALNAQQVFFARMKSDGAIVPLRSSEK